MMIRMALDLLILIVPLQVFLGDQLRCDFVVGTRGAGG